MSVAFETNNNSSDSNRIQLPGFSHNMWIYNLSDAARFKAGNNPWSTNLPAVKEEDDSGSSSSIGKNSDSDNDGDGDGDGDGEVQSKENGVIDGLNDLEKALPIKRGISSFYAGKSKSYGSLADAVSVPSIQDIVKPEDAYSRKRKNMIAHHALLDKRRESDTGKRLARNSSDSGDSSESHSTSMVGRSLPPLPRNSRKPTLADESSGSSPRLYMSSPWRSLSLSDLQHASSFGGVSDNGNEVDGQ